MFEIKVTLILSTLGWSSGLGEQKSRAISKQRQDIDLRRGQIRETRFHLIDTSITLFQKVRSLDILQVLNLCSACCATGSVVPWGLSFRQQQFRGTPRDVQKGIETQREDHRQAFAKIRCIDQIRDRVRNANIRNLAGCRVQWGC